MQQIVQFRVRDQQLHKVLGWHPEIAKRFPKGRDHSLGTTGLNRLFDVRRRQAKKSVDISAYKV